MDCCSQRVGGRRMRPLNKQLCGRHWRKLECSENLGNGSTRAGPTTQCTRASCSLSM